jgi:methionyl-tRNA formyltransferase
VRTVYLGTSEFAASVLRRLAASEHRPALVVTRPDRPRGRGRRMAAPPVAEVARELGARPGAVLVCAFGALIKEPLLSEYPMLNVHPSLLPRWRGAAPIERALMAGDELTGVSIMQLTAGLDSGPVCAQATEPIGPEDTYGTLAARLAGAGAELLVRTLGDQPPCSEQDESLATYAEKITPPDRELDPSRPAAELERVVRALTPHVGAFVQLEDGTRLGVHAARVVPGGTPGLSLDGPPPVLGTVDGSLELVTVQPPGRRPMSGDDYVRGLQGRRR